MKNFMQYGVAMLCILLFNFSNLYGQTITDSQLKKNIVPINNAVSNLLQLQPATYEYDTQGNKSLKLREGKQYGFLADNVSNVFPTMVGVKHNSYMFAKNSYRNTSFNTIDQVSLVPVMVAAIQELHMEIEKLKSQLEALKSK